MTYYHRLSSLNIHFYFSENFGHKHGWSSCWGVQSSSQASVGLTSFQDPQDLLKCMDTVTVENFLCRTKVTPRTFSTDLTFLFPVLQSLPRGLTHANMHLQSQQTCSNLPSLNVRPSSNWIRPTQKNIFRLLSNQMWKVSSPLLLLRLNTNYTNPPLP